MKKRYSEEQKRAAENYFASKDGIILEEEEKQSGNYIYQVQIDGVNKRFKIEDDRLWYFEYRSGHWNWRPIMKAALPEFVRKSKRLDELRDIFLSEMEKTT